jgi:hypothetical protein
MSASTKKDNKSPVSPSPNLAPASSPGLARKKLPGSSPTSWTRFSGPMIWSALFTIVGIIVYDLLPLRHSIPEHLANHPVLNLPNFIPPESALRLNSLMREMGEFHSNTNADLKSGFAGAREDIGEGRPILSDGSCTHPFLIPNMNKTSCILPQRVDVGRHFVMTGGPDGARESYESVVARVSSFGRYMVGDLSKYPVVDELFQSDSFQSAAKQICPADKQVLDPFQFNFIVQVPGQTVALHIDAPYFWGATRKEIPQWLLAVMVFSNLFQEEFVDQVQIVGYLHNWTAHGDPSIGGDFIYYPGDGSVKLLSPEPLTGNAVDGSKTIHAALIYRPDVQAPTLNKNDDAMLRYARDEKWELVINGNPVRTYNSSELRMSIVYRARCFRSENEVNAFKHIPESKRLTVEYVLDKLIQNLARKKIASADYLNAISKLDLALLLMDAYIKYPYPSIERAWIPYNYCALPRLLPWSESIIKLICKR